MQAGPPETGISATGESRDPDPGELRSGTALRSNLIGAGTDRIASHRILRALSARTRKSQGADVLGPPRELSKDGSLGCSP